MFRTSYNSTFSSSFTHSYLCFDDQKIRNSLMLSMNLLYSSYLRFISTDNGQEFSSKSNYREISNKSYKRPGDIPVYRTEYLGRAYSLHLHYLGTLGTTLLRQHFIVSTDFVVRQVRILPPLRELLSRKRKHKTCLV